MTAAVLGTALTLAIGYALIGVAVVAVARATRTLHLAIGPVVVLGVVAWLLLGSLGLPGSVALGAAVLVGAAVSALLEPLVLRPLARRGDPLLVLIGLAVAATVLETGAGRWVTARTVRPDPVIGSGAPSELAGVAVPGGTDAAVLLGVPLVVVLALAVARTRWGRRLQVVGASPEAAEVAGITPARTRLSALAVSGAVAVIAGVLLAPLTSLGVGQGGGLTVRGVAAAMLLGFGGPVGAVVGGVLLGAVDALGQAVWPSAGGTVAVASVVVGVLAVRGRTAAWERPW